MRRIVSKFRPFLACLFVAIAMLAMTSTGFAQDAAAAGADGTPVQKQTLMSVILGHPDFVFVIIMLLSIIGLTLIIQGIIKARKSVFMPEATTELIRQMIAERKFKELIEFTENDPSFISQVLNPALKRAPSFSSMKEAMETAIGEKTAEQFRKIEYLNIIGNLGPLLGLLGTVLGMIEAFSQMQNSGGNANPAELAGGISRALAHTFLGLFLAIPCLASFGIIRTFIDRLTVQGALTAEELLLMIKPAEAKPAAAAALKPATGAAVPATPPGRKPATPQPSPAQT